MNNSKQKIIELSNEDKKWLKRVSFDCDIAYVNPHNKFEMIAVATRCGRQKFVNETLLKKFRESHNMETGEVKPEYIKKIAEQYTKYNENSDARADDMLDEIVQIASEKRPDLSDAIDYRFGRYVIINRSKMQEVEKLLGVNLGI